MGPEVSVDGFGSEEDGRTATIHLRRLVNQSICEKAAGAAASEFEWEFVCECGDPRCGLLVELTIAEFASRIPGSVLAHV
jgi:hypothetical protein